MRKIGLVVNPVAGMGGTVGLKGTDGESYRNALEMGAQPVTPFRTEDFLSSLRNGGEIHFYTAPGKMGADALGRSGLAFTIVGNTGKETSSEDTRRIIGQLLKEGIELLIFVGGDGTARDVFNAAGLDVPVIGVPSGVKVFSSVFALSARAAAAMVDRFLKGVKLKEGEVLDIDEEAFRNNRLSARLYGYLMVPQAEEFLQVGKKASSTGNSATENKDEVSSYLEEQMEPDVLYLLGPGTTMKSLTDRLGIPKTLLGIDAVKNGVLVRADVNEKDILDLYNRHDRRKIIVTPLGGNGFIFGRGSRQFTPRVLSETGKENVILAGDRDKISRLDCLHVDTGELDVDRSLGGYAKVIVGYGETVALEVKF